MLEHGYPSDMEYWRVFWKGQGNAFNVHTDKQNRERRLPEWVPGREIRVFRMPDVDEATVAPLIAGIQEMMDAIGLGFEINDYGVHASVIQQVEQSLDRHGKVSGSNLGELALIEPWRDPERGGSQHADVYITDRYLILGDENWGQSRHDLGYMLLAFPGDRQKSLDFIHNLAKHEAGHLFGFQNHHGNEPSTMVQIYKGNDNCVMKWEASTRRLCDTCLEALRYFWKGAEEKFDMKFLNA